MQNVLFVPDIFYLVLTYFGVLNDETYSNDAKSLFAIALTCKALSPAALDLLWASLEDLSPLMCCLPNDLLWDQLFGPLFKNLTNTRTAWRQREALVSPSDQHSAFGTEHLKFYIRP
jgi:hypothetical protein